eukprot:CAMPEP_0197187266 /NCGR_PEP_ID=MMETSP1423-20130617/15580_1 /TAXON_ID=476441 /ORGANISM="Pseudo-nitzschia heimii, Strain UNC1101" /LENGTH=36 /DNA_ID= /DNA_START= /DNA_END= /DNA_ORIENTATION=
MSNNTHPYQQYFHQPVVNHYGQAPSGGGAAAAAAAA